MFNVRKTIQGRGKPNTLAQTCCMCLKKKEKWNVNHIFLQKKRHDASLKLIRIMSR